jgi:hypothetical protein
MSPALALASRFAFSLWLFALPFRCHPEPIRAKRGWVRDRFFLLPSSFVLHGPAVIPPAVLLFSRYRTSRIAAEMKTAAAPIMIQKTVWNICWSEGAV